MMDHRLVTDSRRSRLCLDSRDGSVLWTRDTIAEMPRTTTMTVFASPT